MEKNKYDLIIIGSGLGGLTTGALLSRYAGKKILMLEKHFKAGGYTHYFTRKQKFSWDVGLHYIGQAGEGEPIKVLFDMISGGKLKWNKMPEPFEKFVYPDFTFSVFSGEKNLINAYIKQFPDQEKGIRNYFRQIILFLTKKAHTSRFCLDYLHLMRTLFKNILFNSNREAASPLFS